jgi:hypothetical protein
MFKIPGIREIPDGSLPARRQRVVARARLEIDPGQQHVQIDRHHAVDPLAVLDRQQAPVPQLDAGVDKELQVIEYVTDLVCGRAIIPEIDGDAGIPVHELVDAVNDGSHLHRIASMHDDSVARAPGGVNRTNEIRSSLRAAACAALQHGDQHLDSPCALTLVASVP